MNALAACLKPAPSATTLSAVWQRDDVEADIKKKKKADRFLLFSMCLVASSETWYCDLKMMRKADASI